MAYDNFKPVVEVTRGRVVESVHFGVAAVVESNGHMLAGFGDPHTSAFLRSSSKPFQALPLVEKGGVEHFQLDQAEIAIMCASHSGTDEHYRVVSSLQNKVGIREEDLKCGVHPPMHEPTWQRMIQQGQALTSNRHNCSGKHSGMLAQAKIRSLPLENYLDFDHPVQKTILQVFSEMCSVDPAEIELGLDGCSAPVFSIPVFNAAYGYARLCDPARLAPERAAACQVISGAMTSQPEMVAGPGRFDTLLMQAGKGNILSKGGAEGFLGIGIKPGVIEKDSPGIGIAIKISDGDLTGRAAPLVGLEILRQLGALDRNQLEEMQKFFTRPVLNWRKLEVGEIRPVFKLVHYG